MTLAIEICVTASVAGAAQLDAIHAEPSHQIAAVISTFVDGHLPDSAVCGTAILSRYVNETALSSEVPVVLLVDDQEESVAMYAIGLLAMGFQPVTSETAEDAFVRACQIRPDIVVADVTLTGASGLELTRQLRRDRRTRTAGIIILTGHAFGSAREEAAAAGCDRFLLKPCPPDVLALEIRGVLNQRQTASELPNPLCQRARPGARST